VDEMFEEMKVDMKEMGGESSDEAIKRYLTVTVSMIVANLTKISRKLVKK